LAFQRPLARPGPPSSAGDPSPDSRKGGIREGFRVAARRVPVRRSLDALDPERARIGILEPFADETMKLRTTRGLAAVREAFGSDSKDGLDRAAFGLVVLFAAAGPWVYGATQTGPHPAWGGGAVLPAGELVIELFGFLAAALALTSAARARSLRPLALPLIAAAALAGTGLLQLLPLPIGVLDRFAPASAETYRDTRELLALFGRPGISPKISIAPGETAGTILLLAAYVALFLTAANVLRTRPRRAVFAGALFASAAVAILGALVTEPPRSRIHSLFANPNHFAGYLEIAFCLAFGILWSEILTGSDRSPVAADIARGLERRLIPLGACALLWGFFAIGIGLTQSRGALLACFATTLVLFGMGLSHRRVKFHRRTALKAAAAILGATLVLAATAGALPLLRLIDSDTAEMRSDSRVLLWRASISAWQGSPVLGSGLGTFREAIRRVQPRNLPGRIEQAHSDPLQLLVTAGVVGAAVGGLLVVSLAVLLARAWRKQAHRRESAEVLAGFGALLCLTLHGLVEFNFSIPIIPATLCCVLGGAWSAGRRGAVSRERI
jgi:O-antigen ligase